MPKLTACLHCHKALLMLTEACLKLHTEQERSSLDLIENHVTPESKGQTSSCEVAPAIE